MNIKNHKFYLIKKIDIIYVRVIKLLSRGIILVHRNFALSQSTSFPLKSHRISSTDENCNRINIYEKGIKRLRGCIIFFAPSHQRVTIAALNLVCSNVSFSDQTNYSKLACDPEQSNWHSPAFGPCTLPCSQPPRAYLSLSFQIHHRKSWQKMWCTAPDRKIRCLSNQIIFVS